MNSETRPGRLKETIAYRAGVLRGLARHPDLVDFQEDLLVCSDWILNKLRTEATLDGVSHSANPSQVDDRQLS